MKRLLILGLLSGYVHAGTVEVPWTCQQGRNESGYLPQNQTIAVEVSRSGNVKFHPDIFKTGSGFNSFFANIFSKKSIDSSVDYSSCMNTFANNFQTALTLSKSQLCGNGSVANDICNLSNDSVQGQFQDKLNKSIYTHSEEVRSSPVTLVVPPVSPVTAKSGVPAPKPTVENTIPSTPRSENGRFLTFLGGGGEPAGATTIFDGSIGTINGLASANDWQTNVIFNGGHSNTEAVIANTFPGKPVENFTQQTYKAMIENYLRKIQSGEIKSGDQIFLVVNTHGAPGTTTNKTHTVATSETEDASGKGLGTVSIDELKVIRDAAEAKGIKLAITDLSCFSGLSQELATDKTCVISATGKLNYAAAGDGMQVFSNRFLSNLQPGRNLEDVYLQSRVATEDPGFPEISSQAGRDVSSELYPLLYRYQMVENRNNGRTFRQLSTDLKDNYFHKLCETESEDMRKLEQLTEQIQDVFKPDMNAVKEAVLDYQRYRQAIYKKLDDLHANEMRGTFKVCEKAVVTWTADGCMEMDNLNILTNTWDAAYNTYRDGTYPKDVKAKGMAYYQKIKDEQARLQSLNINTTAINSVFDSVVDDMTNIYRLADKVSTTARNLYDKMYRSKIQSSTAANPCRDFVL